MPSPMASFTDIAFRRLMDEIGCAGFMVTELISAEALRRNQQRTLDMIQNFNYQAPQFIQLFGSEPQQFIDAARYIEDETTFSGIDINMGCPAPKVTKRGAGAALLNDPARAAAIIGALKKSVRLPVTVKIRLGYNEVNVFEMVRILEQEGADAIAVHFRLKSDGYRGQAKWEYAAQIKELVNTVLIGNGDIVTVQQAREKLESVDAVLIGRGAIRNPLIFREIAGVRQEGVDIRWCINRLLELILEHYPAKLQLPRVKAFARFIFFGRRNCKRIRNSIYTSSTFEEARAHLDNMDLNEHFHGADQSACFLGENAI